MIGPDSSAGGGHRIDRGPDSGPTDTKGFADVGIVVGRIGTQGPVRPPRWRPAGTHKNMKLGVVFPGLLCEPVGGHARPTDEALNVNWLSIEETIRSALESRGIRITDALSDGGPSVRVHDGTDPLPEH